MPIIQSSGVFTIQGFLMSGETIGTFRIVHYIMGVHCRGVSIVDGGVPP